MTQPIRVQLSRAKGWRMPPNTVSVARPGRYGNPIKVGTFRDYTAADAVRDFRKWLDRDWGMRSWENVIGKPPTIEAIRADLGGKNLACWCKPGEPCHADVLLELANP